jgi:hypothetical protein
MFPGFTAADFDAYLPDKWSSNMFTLPRRKVRDKLDAVGRELRPVIDAAGLALDAHLSDDHPSLWNNKKVDTQWLFFSRDEAAQRVLADVIDVEKTLAATLADPTPLYRHLFLGVAVRAEALEVGLWLPHDAWVDRRNFLSLLTDPDGRGRFDALRRGLPAELGFGLAGGDLARAAEIDAAGLDALAREFEEKKGWIFAGVRMPREEAIRLGADALAAVVGLFDRLAALYAFAAWSPVNDAVSIDGVVAARRQALEAAEAEAERERLGREARRREQDEEHRRLREETEERARAEQAWRERERAIRRSAARGDAASEEARAPAAQPAAPAAPAAAATAIRPPIAPAPAPAPAPAREAPRQERVQETEAPPKLSAERMADVRVGDAVVVLRGFLKGRGGVVQSIDEKGDLKVAFGSLGARVPRQDVEGHGPQAPPDGGGRRRPGRQ